MSTCTPRVHVPVTMAALGGSIGFETLDDGRDLAIAPGTQTGTVIPLKWLGVPRLRGRGRGDLYVHVAGGHAHRPRRPPEGAAGPLAEARGEELGQAPAGEGLFSKLRSALS